MTMSKCTVGKRHSEWAGVEITLESKGSKVSQGTADTITGIQVKGQGYQEHQNLRHKHGSRMNSS